MRVSASAARLAGGFAVLAVIFTLAPIYAGTPKRMLPSWRYATEGRIERSLDRRLPDRAAPSLSSSSHADTTLLGSWSFGIGCTAAGWTSVDRTAQVGTFFHVDDFAGLGGGGSGRLVPLEGARSMWCGLRPGQTHPALCSYATLPGYGDDWDQLLYTTACLEVSGDVSVDYLIAWDSEEGYDYTVLEYSDCGAVWNAFDGGPYVFSLEGDGFFTSVLDSSKHDGNVRLRFRFRSDGLWSDEDGLWDSDGAVILDSLGVRDAAGTVLAVELFEDETLGATATTSGNWMAAGQTGYGDMAAVGSGYLMVQESECADNPSCVWNFFAGSTADYACGGYPEQAVVPYGNLRGQWIWNEIWSPWVPIAGTGEMVELSFDVYRDLPLDALVFYLWHVRSSDGGPCPGRWRDNNYVYFGADRDWIRQTEEVSGLIDDGATAIQVALGARDMCGFWCGIYGYGDCHTHAPLFDNVALHRIDTTGPQWIVRDIDLFQDTFASDGTTTGTARVDAGIDINPSQVTAIRPGDSTVVTVFDREYGLAADPHTGSGAAVYAWVCPRNGVDPYSGSEIEADGGGRWPVVDSLVYAGRQWFAVHMDTVRAGSTPVTDAFCVDLDDDRFVPGDTIEFVFAATSAPPGGQTTYWTPFTGTTLSMSEALDAPDECTILPASGWKRGGEVLYVDGFNGRGAQPFFDTAFQATGIYEGVDRYDIRGPGARAGNHPGARVTDVAQQLLPGYRVILWNTGDLARDFIGDGTTFNGKSDDAAMLLGFLDGLQTGGGVFLSGDDIAAGWERLTGAAHTLRDTYIQHTLVADDHAAAGMGNWPLLTGEPGGPFYHLVGRADTTHVLSLCPDLHAFDVLSPGASSGIAMRYESSPYGAVIAQETANPNGRIVGAMLAGFSFHMIRDDDGLSADGLDRFHLMRDIMVWFGITMPVVSGASPGFQNRLAQNVPNPFNPSTIIEFSLRERAQVALRIYDVRGRLVRTLVDGVRNAGASHRIEWDGRNDAGTRVASGVYFCRLATRDFTATRKMVLLK